MSPSVLLELEVERFIGKACISSGNAEIKEEEIKEEEITEEEKEEEIEKEKKKEPELAGQSGLGQTFFPICFMGGNCQDAMLGFGIKIELKFRYILKMCTSRLAKNKYSKPSREICYAAGTM